MLDALAPDEAHGYIYICIYIYFLLHIHIYFFLYIFKYLHIYYIHLSYFVLLTYFVLDALAPDEAYDSEDLERADFTIEEVDENASEGDDDEVLRQCVCKRERLSVMIEEVDENAREGDDDEVLRQGVCVRERESVCVSQLWRWMRMQVRVMMKRFKQMFDSMLNIYVYIYRTLPLIYTYLYT